jgi:hypothetical protein
MIRSRLKYVGFLTLLALTASAKRPKLMEEITPQAVVITSQAVPSARVQVGAPLRFLNAWSLKSSYKYFGGVSAMMHDSSGFTALTDGAALFHFGMDANGKIVNARVAPLPKGCAKSRIKDANDTESMTRDPVNGTVLISFEWRNAFCRADSSLIRAITVFQPRSMHDWPKNGGPEAMVALRDGRTLVFEERPHWGPDTGAVLIFAGDPTAADTEPLSFQYKPPAGFRPTEAIELPGDRLLIVNRKYQFPISFQTELTIIPVAMIKPDAVVSGRTVARLDHPTLSDNFEAAALSQSRGRTFIWLMSDNNFNAYQHSYLAQFELVDGGVPSTAKP